MASFLESKNQTWTQAAHILEQRSEFVFRELQTSTGELSAWSNFAGQFIEGLRTLAVQTVKSVDEVDQALNHLRELLEQLGLPPTRYAGIAELLYCAGRPHKAIEHWRATAADKSAEPDWLIRAHAEIDPYSAKLRYIVRLKDDKALVDAWGKAGENRGKEGEWTHHILASARNLKDWDVIGELLPHVDGIVDSLETLKLALQEEYRDFLAQFPVAFLQLLARTSEWQRLVRFAERQETGDNECDEILKHRSMGWDPVSLRAMAIRVVARSDDLSKEETKAQQAISEFLPRYLVSDRKAKPDERQQVQMLHKYLSVEEGGAALERANRLTFALEYYEQWFTETQFPNKVFRADKTKLRHARTRWVVCKRRLGEVTSGSQSEKHLQEAAISERRWSLSKENQPEIPKLAPLAGTVSLVDIVEADTKKPSVKEVTFKDKTEQKAESPGRDFNVSLEIQMEGRHLRGQMERRKRRLILTDLEKEDHVTCGPEQVSSQDLQVVENGAGRWQIAAWGLVCELERFGESVKVRFFDPGSGELYFGIEL